MMKQFGWNIKVGDLLHNPGMVDELVFEERYVHDMPEIQKPGISGSIELVAINKSSVQVFVRNLSCTVEDISDKSGEGFTRDVYVEEYEVLYSLPDDKIDIDEIYDSFNDIYEIDQKDFSINLEDCITNAIKSQEPIVKLKNDESLSDGGKDDEYDINL